MSCGKTTGHIARCLLLAARCLRLATCGLLLAACCCFLGARNRQAPLVAAAVLDADLDGARDRPRQLLRPLDRQHALHPKLFQAKIVDLSRIVETVQIDVNERDAPAAILLHQGEGRTAHLFGRDAQTFGQTAYERGLPSAEIADEQHDGARLERRCQLPPDLACLRFRLSGDGHVTIRTYLASSFSWT